MDNQSAGSFSFEYLKTHKHGSMEKLVLAFPCLQILAEIPLVGAYLDCQHKHTLKKKEKEKKKATVWPSHSLILHWLFYRSLQPTVNLTSFFTAVYQALKSITSLVKHCCNCPLCVCVACSYSTKCLLILRKAKLPDSFIHIHACVFANVPMGVWESCA